MHALLVMVCAVAVGPQEAVIGKPGQTTVITNRSASRVNVKNSTERTPAGRVARLPLSSWPFFFKRLTSVRHPWVADDSKDDLTAV